MKSAAMLCVTAIPSICPKSVPACVPVRCHAIFMARMAQLVLNCIALLLGGFAAGYLSHRLRHDVTNSDLLIGSISTILSGICLTFG